MKRLAYAGLAPLLVLSAACNSGTFVVLDFTNGPAGATSLACTLSLSGKTATATFSDKGNVLTFPQKASLQIESGSGAMNVACDAIAGQVNVGHVTGDVTVVRDKTETLTLAFQTIGPDLGMGDGSMQEDGGHDMSGNDMTLLPTVLTATPVAHDYGTVTTMSTSPSFAFTITNTGSTPTAALAVTVDNPQFTLPGNGTCQGAIVAAGATCVVEVAYMPSSATATAGTLHVTYAGLPGADEATAQLSGMGVAAGSLKWSQASADFGTTLVGASGTSKTFTLTNNNTTTATSVVTIGLTGTDITAFSVTDDECTGTTLAPMASCMVTVQFTPDTAGMAEPSLLASATTGGSDTVVLMGVGQAPATLVLTPDTSSTAHDFATVDIGNTSAPFTVTVSNTGDVQTGTLSYVATGVTIVTGAGAGTCAATGTSSISAKGSCTLVLTMTPTTYGVHTGTVTFSATPGGSVTTHTTVTGQDYVTVMAATAGTLLLPGTGSVSDGATIMCGAACEAVYPRTSVLTVTLIATPDSGSAFSSWTASSGAPACADASSPTCVLTFGPTFVGGATNTPATSPPTYTASFSAAL